MISPVNLVLSVPPERISLVLTKSYYLVETPTKGQFTVGDLLGSCGLKGNGNQSFSNGAGAEEVVGDCWHVAHTSNSVLSQVIRSNTE